MLFSSAGAVVLTVSFALNVHAKLSAGTTLAKRNIVPMLTAPLLTRRDDYYYGEARYSDFQGTTACGQQYPNTYDIKAGGVPPAFYQNVGENVCGKCITVTNTNTDASITVQIIEKCGKGCGDKNSDYGVLLSRKAYAAISPTGSTDAPPFDVQWSYTYDTCDW